MLFLWSRNPINFSSFNKLDLFEEVVDHISGASMVDAHFHSTGSLVEIPAAFQPDFPKDFEVEMRFKIENKFDVR